MTVHVALLAWARIPRLTVDLPEGIIDRMLEECLRHLLQLCMAHLLRISLR